MAGRAAIFSISILIGLLEIGLCFGQYYQIYSSFNSIRPSSWFRQGPDDLTCKEPTGQFNHPKYCDQFLNCWKGRPTVGTCNSGLVFNEAIAACDYRRNVDCGGRGDSKAPLMLDPRCKEPYGTYPNPNNCSEYFVCHGGVAKVISCPDNSYYDTGLGVCTHDRPPGCHQVEIHPCRDASSPRCPPVAAGTPTQSPSPPSEPSEPTARPTAPFKPKPQPGSEAPAVNPNPTVGFKPRPPLEPSESPAPEFETPRPSRPKPDRPSAPVRPPPSSPSPTKPEEPSEQPPPQEVVTVAGLKPKPPLKPQNPTHEPEQPSLPPEIAAEVKPPEEVITSKPPPLKPGGLKPVQPGGPPNIGPTTPKPDPVDGEDDPNVLFPFLPAYPGSFRCPISNGIMPVVGDCESIVVCINDAAHLVRCPEGHSFDVSRRMCASERSSLCQYAEKRPPSKILYVSVPSSLLYEELGVLANAERVMYRW